jgi:hypothetical protein
VNPTALPPGTLGVAALFWGAQADVLPWAIPAAAALEAPRLFARRWALGRTDFNRLSDLCAALFGVMVVYIYATREAPDAILTIFRLGPFTLLPLVFGQIFSERGRVDLSAFFLFLRRSAEREGFVWEIDLGYPFLALMLLGAASGNHQTPVFFAGSALLIAVGLWSARPRRVPAARWISVWAFATVLGLGVLGVIQYTRTHVYRSVLEWSLSKIGPRVDPSRAPTAIGRIGRLQGSGAVVLRVFPGEQGGPVPALLRDAAFDVYADETWFASSPGFAPLQASEPVGTWNLDEAEPRLEIVVSKPLENGTGLLSLPYGASRVSGLPAESAERSRFGVVRVDGGPGYATYRIGLGSEVEDEGPPVEADLKIPKKEAEGLRRVAAAWGMTGAAPGKALERMLGRFERDFHYSVYRKEPKPDRPIEEFLTVRKRGHCEYFAASAALLLRAAGIPARYASGFAVREPDRFEDGFVVRARHAHAWTRAFVDGRWRTVDATPATWWGVENERGSRLRPVMDAFAWVGYRWSAWRWRPVEEDRGIAWWVWALAAVAGFIVWRNFRDWRPKAASELRNEKGFSARGLDSELFALEGIFAEGGAGRRPEESLRRWCERNAGSLGDGRADLWRRAGRLHERLRFDPAGLADDERAELAKAAAELTPKS